MPTHKASCLCGAVQITVEGDLPRPSVCHCRECRKHSGHLEASVDVPESWVTVTGAEAVGWFQSSEKVRRGFCKTCGSTLFWDPIFRDWTAIAMGAFDTPTGTQIAGHIFVEEKGDYYEINDGLPQNAR
ncbi:hypothetical protein FHS89_002922 [Rubricella aquisinus]|uniref:CENP-V/GFA domain-containing protein n=1 Tax=Rubricella aquisinus TaxID=2028108 RepID=A0A840WP93_9RHOB|nr:GFA family protein [Rubricella aquisinus]MBB5516878.1 hypothetical protein [Rubricella aquisinus]